MTDSPSSRATGAPGRSATSGAHSPATRDGVDPAATGDLSVLEAWRLLVRPVPSRQAPGYVGIVAVIGLINLSAISAIVASAAPDPTVAAVAGLIHTAKIQPDFVLNPRP